MSGKPLLCAPPEGVVMAKTARSAMSNDTLETALAEARKKLDAAI